MKFSSASAQGKTQSGQQDIPDLHTKSHYASRAFADDVLPIERETQSNLIVSTSNQLLFAVQSGLYPRLAAGSVAERIWTKAKEVSLRIINSTMSDRDKIHAIYDYLTLEVTYDYKLQDLVLQDPYGNFAEYSSFFMEGVFDDGVAVCDGIAKAFLLLGRMQGIAVEKEAGYVLQNKQQVGHVWNRVMLDGQWYVCDATWGNRRYVMSNGTVSELQTHEYLLVADSVIADDHIGYGKYPSAPEGMDAYYLVEFGSNFDATLDSAVEMRTGADAIVLSALRGDPQLSVAYWEVKISDVWKAELKRAYPDTDAVSAVGALWREYAEQSGYAASVITVGGSDTIYLIARKRS